MSSTTSFKDLLQLVKRKTPILSEAYPNNLNAEEYMALWKVSIRAANIPMMTHLWSLDKNKTKFLSYACCTELLDIAAEICQTKVVKFLFNTPTFPVPKSGIESDGMFYLFDKIVKKVASRGNVTLFTYLTRNWAKTHYKEYRLYGSDYSAMFKSSFVQGHISMCRYLLKAEPNCIDIDVCQDAFNDSIQNYNVPNKRLLDIIASVCPRPYISGQAMFRVIGETNSYPSKTKKFDDLCVAIARFPQQWTFDQKRIETSFKNACVRGCVSVAILLETYISKTFILQNRKCLVSKQTPMRIMSLLSIKTDNELTMYEMLLFNPLTNYDELKQKDIALTDEIKYQLIKQCYTDKNVSKCKSVLYAEYPREVDQEALLQKISDLKDQKFLLWVKRCTGNDTVYIDNDATYRVDSMNRLCVYRAANQDDVWIHDPSIYDITRYLLGKSAVKIIKNNMNNQDNFPIYTLLMGACEIEFVNNESFRKAILDLDKALMR